MSDSDSDQEPLNQDLMTTIGFSRRAPKQSSKSTDRKWPHLIDLTILGFLIAISVFILTRPQSSVETSQTAPIASYQPQIVPPSFLEKQTEKRQRPLTLFQHSKVQEPFSTKTSRGDYRKRVLCKISKNTNCRSYFIADVIDLFWVIAPIYSFDVDNDWQYLKLHEEFKSCMKSYGLQHITIEAIRYPENYNQRTWSREPTEYHATIPGNEPYDMQVYYYNMSYIRENLLNVAIRKLDQQAPWEYVAWIDAHQYFQNPYWWEEAIYKTEKYGSVQLFETIEYLPPNNQSQNNFQFGVIAYTLFTNEFSFNSVFYGNAYAITKDMYKQIGFIYDECIATSCDCAYVLASIPDNIKCEQNWAPLYFKNFESWIHNTKQVFQSRRAYVGGHLSHFYHGGSFPYFELQAAVENYGFNASLDIKRDQNFSVYIDNRQVSTVMEWIIYDSKKKSAKLIH